MKNEVELSSDVASSNLGSKNMYHTICNNILRIQDFMNIELHMLPYNTYNTTMPSVHAQFLLSPLLPW